LEREWESAWRQRGEWGTVKWEERSGCELRVMVGQGKVLELREEGDNVMLQSYIDICGEWVGFHDAWKVRERGSFATKRDGWRAGGESRVVVDGTNQWKTLG
jgi:hypothetical protein